MTSRPCASSPRGRRPSSSVVSRRPLRDARALVSSRPPMWGAGASAAICMTARSSTSLAVGNLLQVAQRKLGDDHEAAAVLRLAGPQPGEAHSGFETSRAGCIPWRSRSVASPARSRGSRQVAPLPVTIDVRARDLPEHIELAAYFIVSESLTNAAGTRTRARTGSASSASRGPGHRDAKTAAVARTPRSAPGCTGWPTDRRARRAVRGPQPPGARPGRARLPLTAVDTG